MDENSSKSLVDWLKKVFNRLAGIDKPEELEKEIQELIEEGELRGIISEDEGEMIQGIFSFRDTIAREIMVPRTDVTAISSDTRLGEIVQIIVQSGHSRLPVFEDTLDNIVGIVHAKDLLRYWGESEIEAKDLVRPSYYIPETKKISAVFTELRRKKSHMAIVVDEYGGTAGILTLEDIIEEIVGDIMDEYDSEDKLIEESEDGSIIVDARLDMEDLEEYMKVDLPEGAYESVGGLIISILGRVPRPGEIVECGEIEMEVLSATEKKIEKVRVRKINMEEADEKETPSDGSP